MSKIDAQKLKPFFEDVQDFAKTAQALVESQFGDQVDDAVVKTAQLLVETDQLEASDMEGAKQTMKHSKTAALETIRRLAERVDELEGELQDKVASPDLGHPVKSASSKKESERTWDERLEELS